MGPPEGADRRTALTLLPLDPLPPGLGEELVARVSRRVHLPCRLAPQPPDPAGLDPPWLPGRAQVDADRLLDRLESFPSEGFLVGVTARDLAIPIFTFVFGRARQHGRAALVSTARLDPAFYGLPPARGATVQRAASEVLHELGHVAGLGHCPDAACLMSFAGSVAAVDVRGSSFCATCAERLPGWLGGG